MNFFWGFLGIAAGLLLIAKTDWFVQNFGANAWAEEHMGTSGGTRLMYKLVGLVFILIAMMGMTGLLGGFILGTFGKLFTFGV